MVMSKGFAPILIVIIITALISGYLIYKDQTKPIPSSTIQLKSTTSIQQCGQEGGDVPGIPCPSGYICQPVENVADSAVCVKK